DMAASTRKVIVLSAYAHHRGRSHARGTPDRSVSVVAASAKIVPWLCSVVVDPPIPRPPPPSSGTTGPRSARHFPRPPSWPAPSAAAGPVSAPVHQTRPDLDWEVGHAPKDQPGALEDLDLSQDVHPDKLLTQLAELETPSQMGAGPSYTLTLRPGHSDEARIQAERWARSAPEDSEWTFLPVRPADHEELGRTVSWDDHEFDLSHVSVSMRVDQATGKV